MIPYHIYLYVGDDDQDLFNLSFSVVRIFDPTTEEVNCVLAHGVFPTARSRQVTEFFERKREIVMFGGKVNTRLVLLSDAIYTLNS